MAPLAATLAATFAVGVGVALARNGRERRRIVPAPLPEPHFALLPGEPLGAGARRIAIEQCDLAIALLGGGGRTPDERAVHETRKALKRLRTLVRLLEEQLGAQAYARESASLRTIAARLSGARDAEVMLATLDATVARAPKLARRRGMARLRKSLAAEQRRAAAATLGHPGALAPALAELQALRWRLSGWHLADRKGLKLLERDLRGIYATGRRRRRRAIRARRNRDVALHEWRKRAKDLRYACELLQRRKPSTHEARDGSADGRVRVRSAKYLARTARRADELGELLGEDHDLALLAQLVREKPSRGGLPGKTRRRLLKAVARRRRSLRRRALRISEKLYAPAPKRFVRLARKDFDRQRRPLGSR